MNINQIITSAISDQVAASVSKKLGIPQSKSKGVIDMAIPLLIGGLAKNSSDPTGAQNLSTALTQDHDGSILNNIPSALSGDNAMEEGGKILNHVLGNKQDSASQVIGSQVNVEPSQVQQILSLVAPVVLGALGKQQQKANLDAGGLSTLLKGAVKQKSAVSPKHSGLISQILDQNNDGSIIDDVAKIGGNILSNLFSKK
jgi:hypothetical protein